MAFIVKSTLVERVPVELVPEIVMLSVPKAALPVLDIVIMLVFPGVTGLGEKLTTVPECKPVAVKLTSSLKLRIEPTSTEYSAVCGAQIVCELGVAEMEKSG